MNSNNDTITFTTYRKMDTGAPNDYNVPYDTDITMIWGYNTDSAQFVRHTERGWFALRFNTPGADGQSSVGGAEVVVEDPAKHYRTHGWIMWVAWSVLGWLMVATKRYMSHNWLVGQMIHSLCGYFITLATFVEFFKNLSKKKWTLEVNPHSILACIILSTVTIMTMSGMMSIMVAKVTKVRQW